jgi:hypothetical protein
MRGEVANGDQIAIVETVVDITIAVIDGLGRGPEAEHAALLAAKAVRDHAAADVDEILHLSDVALRGSRGAAMTVLRVNALSGRVRHAGIGNIEVALLPGSSFRGVLVPGVVGGSIRKVVVTESRLELGDLLVVHTDGVSRRMALEPLRTLSARVAAREVLTRYGKDNDDAACVVVRR